jgi:metallo-beta-lactamase family protein
MRVNLHGAANEVTGSCYQVQSGNASLLIDFGAFQGGDSRERNEIPAQLDVKRLDAVLLTHGHLDHCGRLPLLARRGYRGPIYATEATISVASLILRDSAHVLDMEVARLNRKLERAGRPLVQPSFSADDVAAVIKLMRPAQYEEPVVVAPGVSAVFHEAGHLLGSSSIELLCPGEARAKRVVFSGDLGPQQMPILRDPARLKDADWVFMESTYGDRDHRPLDQTLVELTELVKAAVAKKGKILVPSFAVGRSQDIIYHLANLFRGKVLPVFPVYLDSPMAIAASELYERYTELHDEPMKRFIEAGGPALMKQFVHESQTAEESKALNHVPGPCMILAGAGMCNAGRILHHLKHNLWRPQTTVIFVGYQAPGSLGRNLIDGKNPVRIFGEEIAVNATIRSLGGFSAHAGQSDLLAWLEPLAASRPRVTLAHGEEKGRKPLARLIKEKWGIDAELPSSSQALEY